MTDEQIDSLAGSMPFMKAWVQAVEAEILSRLESGVALSNVALVPKRATRKWDETLDILALLQELGPLDKIAPRVPLSPSQADKEFGKSKLKDFAQYVVKESSGVTLSYQPKGR